MFPATDLDIHVEAAIGYDPTTDPLTWLYTDLSLTDRLADVNITTRDGKSPQQRQTDAGTCSFVLFDPDGDLIPQRAMSPYYPYIDLDLPMRCRLRRARDLFARTESSGWGTSDYGQTWTTSGGAGSDYSVSSAKGRHLLTSTNVARHTILGVALRDVEVQATIALGVVPTGDSILAGLMLRRADASNFYLAELVVHTSGAVDLRITKTVAGSATTLVTASSLFTAGSGTSIRVKFHIFGEILVAKAWDTSGSEPATWQAQTSDEALTAPGAAGCRSMRVTGNTNTNPTATFADVRVEVDLGVGGASAITPTFVPTTEGVPAVAVRFTLGGPLRSFGQGDQTQRSAMFEYLTSVTPLAYVPFEDGTEATQFASGLSGGTPTGFLLEPEPGAYSEAFGSMPYATFPATANEVNASFATTPIVGATPGVATFGYLISGEIDDQAILSANWNTMVVNMSGGSFPGLIGAAFAEWDGTNFGFVGAVAYPSIGGSVSIGANNPWDGQPHDVLIRFIQNGADVDVQLWMDGVAGNIVTYTSKTLGTPVSISGPTTNNGSVGSTFTDNTGSRLSLGHAFFLDATVDPDDFHQAAIAWAGEQALARAQRNAAAEGVSITVVGDTSQTMGPQIPGGFLERIRDTERSDIAQVGEAGFGLTLIGHAAPYNRAVDMTVDMTDYLTTSGTQNSVLQPVVDDQQVRNQWTVSSPSGSSATYRDIKPGRRLYSDQITANVYNEADLMNHASHRVRLGNLPETRKRYPDTPIDLAANPDLIDSWLSLVPGLSRVVRTGLPDIHGIDDLDVIMTGRSNNIRRRSWTATYNGIPVDSVLVGTAGDGSIAGSWTQTGPTTQLAGTLAIGATAASVTIDGPLFTTSGAALSSSPLRIILSARLGDPGEICPVTSISGAGSPQTINVTRTLARAWPAGTIVQVYRPLIAAL